MYLLLVGLMSLSHHPSLSFKFEPKLMTGLTRQKESQQRQHSNEDSPSLYTEC